MPPYVLERLDEIRELCDRYGVQRLDLFGSAVTDRFDPATSDLDFVVDFVDRSPGSFDRYLDVAEGLEAILHRGVDLVTDRSITSPAFRGNIDRNRTPVYDADPTSPVDTTGRFSPREGWSVNERVEQRLRDAREAAGTITEFLVGQTFDDYVGSRLLRSGVERQLEIVGEALNQAATLDRDLEDRIPELRAVVGLRNRLIHGYRDVDKVTVWTIVHDGLPDLMARLDDLLAHGYRPDQ